MVNGRSVLTIAVNEAGFCSWSIAEEFFSIGVNLDDEGINWRVEISLVDGPTVSYFITSIPRPWWPGPLTGELDFTDPPESDPGIPTVTVVPGFFCRVPPGAGELLDQAGEVITDQAGAPIEIQG